MQIYEVAALGAAMCWAISALLSPGPSHYLGASAFNRLRQLLVFLMLAAYVLLTDRWQSLRAETIVPIVLSGLIGIFVGDTLLFACMNRLGPRRSSILFAMNAPLAALLGWWVLHETLSMQAVAGIALSFAGVAMAIYFGGAANKVDVLRGALWAGVLIGLGSALCQAIGSLIMRPVMNGGGDPVVASMLRVGIGAVALTVAQQLPIPAMKPRNPLTARIVALTALNGFIALGVGMTLLMW